MFSSLCRGGNSDGGLALYTGQNSQLVTAGVPAGSGHTVLQLPSRPHS